MIKDKVPEDICYGCGACVIACPQNALRLEINEKGFLVPQLVGKCSHCDLCENVCPVLNPPKKTNNVVDIFAARSRSKRLRLIASSGGVASSLSLAFIKNYGSVIGVTFSKEYALVYHKVARIPQETVDFVGSKYVQSISTWALQRVKASNSENRYYLFFGTPCQVAGVRNLVEKGIIRSKIILVDLFCHGVASYKLWWAYINWLRKRIGAILFIEQRFKLYDWHRYCVRAIGSRDLYLREHNKDPFMFLFLNNYFLRGPCFRCPFRALNSVADLRLGDFWGPLYAKDKLGVSLILVLSEKARQLLVNTHDILLESQPLSESLIKHSQLMSIEKPKDYDIVLKELVDTMDLEHLMRSRFSWKIVKTRIRSLLRHILYLGKNVLEVPLSK